MLVTEEEAKTKQCLDPGCGKFVKVGPGDDEDSWERICIGSRCMGWRWAEGMPAVHADRKGYCGKAGKP